MVAAIDRILVVVDASTQGAVREFDSLQRSAKQTDTSMQGLSINASKFGGVLKAGLAAAGGALLGGGLIAGLNMVTDRFVEAQTAAAQFARATNASVEEAGAFTTVARNFGLDMNDLIEINAEFSKKIQTQPELLQKLNVEIAKNADGSTNMTKTLVSTIDALGQMEDGLGAAQIAAELFGEEGSKQLAAFYLAGIDVADLMDRIDFVDNSDAALEFSAATQELGLAFDQLAISVGSQVVPILTDLADAGLAVFDFLSSIPKEAYAVAAGFIAINVAAANWGAIKQFGVAVLDVGLNLASWSAQDGAVKSLAGKLGDVAAKAGPLLVLAAAMAVVVSAIKEAGRVREFTTDIDNVTQSLEEQAKALEATESWWNRQVGTTETKMQQITLETKKAAEASLARADASKAERAAAQALLDVMGDGTLAQQTAKLATDEGNAAQQAYAKSLSASGFAAQQAREDQIDLADALADIIANGANAVTTWADIAAAASEAAEAQSETKRVTELTAVAMGEYAVSLQDAVEWQRRLAGIPIGIGEGMDALQQSVADVDELIKNFGVGGNDPETWSDDWSVAVAEVQTDIYDLVDAWAAAGQTPLEITTNLEKLRSNLPPELQYVVDEAIASVSGKQNDIPVNLKWQEENLPGIMAQVADLKSRIRAALAERNYGLANALQAELDALDPAKYPDRIAAAISSKDYGLAETLTAQYNAWALTTGAEQLTITYTADGTAALGVLDEVTGDKTATVDVDAETGEAKSAIDNLTGDKTTTLTVETAFSPGGYEAVKARRDFLMQAGNSTVDIDVSYGPGGYEAVKARKDFLMQARSSTITINVNFEPGSYVEIMKRINTIAQNRTVTITQVVNQVRGSKVSGAEDPEGFSLPRLRVPEVAPTINYSPYNAFKINLDGTPLRAMIREEVAALQPAYQGVA